MRTRHTIAVGRNMWKDKQTRDAGWQKMMQDERMTKMQMPFDGKRMIFGTFWTGPGELASIVGR